MFIFTAKVNRKKILLGAAAVVALVLTAGVGVRLAGDVAAISIWDTDTEDAAGSGEQAEETVSTLALTNEERIEIGRASCRERV